jgi:ABC-2 type transport system ATP-binding protein
LAALLAKPGVLIIDEPVAGLDPTSIKIFGRSLKKFAQEGGTVLLATHILSFGQEFATRVGVMSHGQIKLETEIKKRKLEDIYEEETK